VAAAQTALNGYLKTPTKVNISTPLKSPPPTGKTVVYLGTTDPQNVEIQQELKTIAGDVGWNYSQIDYDPANTGAFQAAVNTALEKHPTFLSEAGIPLTPSLLAQVAKAGVTWVPMSVYPLKIKPPVISNPDSYAQDTLMGKVVGDYFVADSKGKGNALIVHVPSYPVLDGFTNEFQKVVKSYCSTCPMKMLNLTIPQIGNGQLSSLITAAVKSDPSASYLVFDDGTWSQGITSALSAAGLSGKVKIIGEAGNQEQLAALHSGQEQMWTGFYPQMMAMQAFDAMFRHVEGMPVPAADSVMPTQALTKSTVGSSDSWQEPSNALAQYEALWKK
jgi:ribose transport system substrate-binding protein